jgi:hypothetical protein
MTQAVFFAKRRTCELPSTLDKKLTFSLHFDYISDKVQKLTRILYPLINSRSTLSLETHYEKFCHRLMFEFFEFEYVYWPFSVFRPAESIVIIKVGVCR